jgi:RNA polymerase sigma factor (sigma-70 family)
VNGSEREKHWTELMEQSLQGDSCAYQRLLVLLTVAVRNVVRWRACAAGLDPEDVVQEVLLALHLKRSTWLTGTPVAPWVAAIARNKIVDALRRRGTRIEVPLDDVVETLWTDAPENEGQAHDLERALGRLNERQRDIVRAVSIEGHTAHEVATRLRMTEGAVRVTLHRSLKALAAAFRAVPNED